MAKLPDIQVVLPYKDLLELLEASKQVGDLKADNKRLHDQMDALRSQFTELMDKFGELRREVID